MSRRKKPPTTPPTVIDWRERWMEVGERLLAAHGRAFIEQLIDGPLRIDMRKPREQESATWQRAPITDHAGGN